MRKYFFKKKRRIAVTAALDIQNANCHKIKNARTT